MLKEMIFALKIIDDGFELLDNGLVFMAKISPFGP